VGISLGVQQIECAVVLYTSSCYIAEMTPEVAAELFYNGELELELKRIGLEDYRFKVDSDRESCFERVDEVRRASVYPHPSD